MSKLLSLVLLLAAACGGSQPPASTRPRVAEESAPGPAGVALALAEIRLVDVAKKTAIVIHADGTLELQGVTATDELPKVTADGKIVRSSTGAVGFQLLADGTIRGPEGVLPDIRIATDGTVTSGDKTISIDDTGALIGGNPAAPQLRIEGATTPALRRTAMFVLVSLTSPGNARSAPKPLRSDSSGTP